MEIDVSKAKVPSDATPANARRLKVCMEDLKRNKESDTAAMLEMRRGAQVQSSDLAEADQWPEGPRK